MCGIVGYVGYRKAVPVLLHGLQRLEYRGYDSAGLAVLDEKSKKIIVEKQVGKIKDLQEYIWGKEINGNIGIAHTRWATHGPPSIENAHPHTSKSEAFAVVHNGIIENYAKLKDELIKKGYQFKSQTDTEVIAHLLEEYYEKDLLTTVLKVAKMIEGAYAIGVISTVEPDKIVALRKGSPLVVGIGEGENFIASDIPAILEYTKTFIALDDEEIAVITKDKVEVYDINGNKVEKKPFTVKWDLAAAEKGGFKHFMLKEIYEQPKTITDTISGFFSDLNNPVYNEIKNIQNIVIIACGTSYHAGLVGKFWIEKFVKIPTIVDYASEFRYRDFPVNEKTLIIAISQSGETADTRFSAIDARKKSAKVLSIVNVVGSSLSRESDFVIYTYCGPEIGVAATKTFTAQLITLLLFSLKAGLERGNLTQEEFEKYYNDIIHLPHLVNEVLKQDKAIEEISYKYHNVKDFLFLGRGLNYPIAFEGALKLKEISYIHAEGYPAGEMKHGPIALIDENLPVVCIVPKDSLYEKMISNIQEVKARKGIVISVSDSQDSHLLSLSDNIIKIPSVENENLYPIVSVIPLQLLAYHIATILGKDVDQPRNLAKTVTVE
ncbi:glutamine--fructose-6-phosphate transaminase (isomerizing) [Sulfurihydrogenibium azorense]|jgi:glucosamine--fructose-6-phosphate aminotransferase (isomerizing)|uniref:glutamine--fructose-6-phosphate transaminase (isomerizing) n=1 Tax=Sulfurihydrogenibium azorense TaxID=309806 RepID=UPI0024093373|nr:glutamine--fructose-6-phosphate transaminase (isomerizing) [Sulfurihydrogenibium azorense]MDM7273988.1 glutamine--fructose-6-phosphate transaminase (isomerizing) [Sulfurihydrogenibium azorense]